jgi:hypothetical protein
VCQEVQISILLRGTQLTNVQRYMYRGSTVKMVFSYKIFTCYEANTCVALPNNNGSESTVVKTVELR